MHVPIYIYIYTPQIRYARNFDFEALFDLCDFEYFVRFCVRSDRELTTDGHLNVVYRERTPERIWGGI